MTKTKYTPGPWHVSNKKLGMVSDSDNLLASVYPISNEDGSYRWGSKGELIANCCLIAAAPEMKDELEKNLEILVALSLWIQTGLGGVTLPKTGQMILEDINKRIEAIRAALAKATGAAC